MNRGPGLASLNRYWRWGSEMLPKPGELEYLGGATLGAHGQRGPTGTRGCISKTVKSDTLVKHDPA
jgi:hypothetical protein